MSAGLVAIGVVAVIVLILLFSAVRVLREYERGVIFRLGRLIAQKGPGLILLIPIIDKMVRVDLRTVTLNVPPQEVITKDNVTVRVTAVAYFRVIDPNKAITEIENFLLATSQISQTTLRSVLGKAELDSLLSERERLNSELQLIIDEQIEPWGVKVSTVEVKDVELPAEMQRAIARQAEAERERRAKVIAADGEFQAADKLGQAADIFSRNPATMQLRYLQTLLELDVNQNSTIVFPLPMDLITPLIGALDSVKEQGGGGSGGGGGRSELPAEMQRAIARQAEAERERRAKVIAAEGEFQAAEKLGQAADIMSRNPATLQLRYLQTLLEMGVNQNTTIVFPIPLDLVKPFFQPDAPASVAPVDQGETPSGPRAVS